MKISVAMATYNGEKYLQEQLDSFVKQICQPDELVVCDDGSTDSTLGILEAFRQQAPFAVDIYRNSTNLGHIKNFEKVLSLCSGDLIFISDQDDVWDINKISLVHESFNGKDRIDVIINDAYYTDENLYRSGVTVLQKVKSVGGDDNAHIAGACTAITKNFRDFLLPFPENNCPQHDVYIHRWANLIGNKFVLTEVLQIWRIHGRNATTNNEMTQPELVSPFSRYKRSKNVDATDSYLKKASEFKTMNLLLKERSDYLLRLPSTPPIETIRLKINQIVDANLNRAKLSELNWLQKKKLIILMVMRGQYSYFKGFKSIAKDILR